MRYLADTSVWIDHLHAGSDIFAALLNNDRILIHPFVIGEIACGSLRNRAEVLARLRKLPRVHIATDDEAHRLLSNRSLHSRGIGWIDLHLMTSALLSECGLLTLDKSLATVAFELSIPGST